MYREDRQIREWHAAACAVRSHAPCQRSGATLRRITRAPLMRATHGQALGRSGILLREGVMDDGIHGTSHLPAAARSGRAASFS